VRVVVVGALGGVAAVVVALAAQGGVAARVPARDASLTRIGTFDFPVQASSPQEDRRRLFVVEKVGRIRLVLDGRILPGAFLDVSKLVAPGNEPGLLSMAFAPGYARNGLFYVYYVGHDRRTHLVEYRRSRTNPHRGDPASRREVLSLQHDSGEHFGGYLLFGADRRLYLSTGDGGLNEWQDKMRAQRLNDPNGKILRVDRRSGATRVVVRGLRNPWRFTFDHETGDLYVGEPGEFVRESINYAPAGRVEGANFGWPCFEGSLASTAYPARSCPGARSPLYEYAREGGNCSVIGGVVVRDPRLPLLAGRYLFADHCLGEVNVLRVLQGRLASRRSLRLYQPGVTSFSTDARRRVYVTTAGGGVYRLDPPAPARVTRTAARSGRELFLASGCGTCHTLARANTRGAYGPNLDVARPSRSLVVDRVTSGKGAMPYFAGRLTRREIERLADYVSGR
jgi:glucose/arabinose dehydrogenase/mono/diheme cytochrome c family protein